jgi:hypothetical protein
MSAMASAARRLTIHQQSVLIQVLRTFPEQRAAIHYVQSTPDASAYAQDFLTIFKSVGWSVNDPESGEPSAGQDHGLTLVVGHHDSVPPAAEALRDALRIYGIEVQMERDASGKTVAESFTLCVG